MTDPYRTADEVIAMANRAGDDHVRDVIRDAMLRGATSSEILGELRLAAHTLLARRDISVELRALVARLEREVSAILGPCT